MNDRRALAAWIACAAFALPLTAQTAVPPSAAPEFPSSPSPVSLGRALELALARSPEATIVASEAKEARASARLAAAPFRPEAWATTTPGYASGLPVAVAGQVPSLFGVAVRTTLYDPSRRASVFGARADADVREAAVARSLTAVSRALVSAYGRAAADAPMVDGARRVLEAREAILRRASALGREGKATPLEVSRAELDVARARQRLLDSTLGMDLDLLDLKRLIDWPADERLTLSDEPLAAVPEPPFAGNLDAARAADPEGPALDRQLEDLARAAQMQARAFQPVILAEAQYLRLSSYNNFDQYFVRFKPNDLSVALAVSVPLWTGGRAADAATAARARLERAEAVRRARTRDLELSVRRAEAELVRSGARWRLAKSAAAVAEESLRVARALGSEGRGEANAIELAEIAAVEAREDLANAAQAQLSARLALLELRGELPGAFLGTSASSPAATATR